MTVVMLYGGHLAAKEISGSVQIPAPASERTTSGKLHPAPDAAMSVYTTDGEMLTTGVKSGKDGRFSIDVARGAEKPGKTVVEAITSMGRLRAIATSGSVRIDPVSEALTEWLLGGVFDPDNYSAAELKFIGDELSGIAKNINFDDAENATDAVTILLNNTSFNDAVGNLTKTYSSPGDTTAAVEKLKKLMRNLIAGFRESDTAAVMGLFAETATVEISNYVYSYSELADAIEKFNSSVSIQQFDVEIENVVINGKTAVVGTIEKIVLRETGYEKTISDAFYMDNKFNLINGEWKLVERISRRCAPEEREITADGDISDWIGVSACVLLKFRSDNNADFDHIDSLYFAKDDNYLYWRMDVNPGKTGDDTISSFVIPQRVPRGQYAVTFFNVLSEDSRQYFMNIIDNTPFAAVSFGKKCTENCIKKYETVKEKADAEYKIFGIGRYSVEGRIPLKDIAFLSDNMDVVGMITYDSDYEKEKYREMITDVAKMSIKLTGYIR